MQKFCFRGVIPPSKSILNRQQIIASFADNPKLCFDSVELKNLAQDVQDLNQSLVQFSNGEKILQCGAGGTTFRFLAARVSRQPGEYLLKGSQRLLERPHRGLLDAFEQLSIATRLSSDGLVLETKGWNCEKPLTLSTEISSQFLSAILLSAWNLPRALTVEISGPIVSVGYLSMTIAILQSAGMKITWDPFEHKTNLQSKIEISAGQKPQINKYLSQEPDLSSAFAVAALAAVAGKAVLEKFPATSLQPDLYGFEILKNMGVNLEFTPDSSLQVSSTNRWNPIRADLTSCPDLLPIVGILCAQAPGVSELTGIEHASGKESNRILKTQELLSKLGVVTKFSENCLVINGGWHPNSMQEFNFDPSEDHRMAMAAEVARKAGAKINILDLKVVEKSFPQFWDYSRGVING